MKTRACFPIVLLCLAAVFSRNVTAGETPTGTWAKIYSSDILAYAANLRAAGVPEATVGVLVSQEINTRFKAREEALEPSLNSLQTLKEGWSAERREALVQLKHEKNELLRATLGAVPVETAKIAHIPESLADATQEQREMVRLIMEDYYAMSARVHTESRGYLLEEDKEKLRYLDNEVTADLAKVLKPEQALDYQIDRDGYMRFMRQRLELFKPTPQEVRDIYQVRKKTGLDIESRNPTLSNHLIDLQKVTNEQLAALWGPERYTEYHRALSRQYQQIYHLVRRRELPLKIADQIYDSYFAATEGAYQKIQEMRAAGPRVIQVQPGERPERPPSPGDTAKALIAEHCALVKQLLGEAGYNEYYQFNSRVIDIMSKGGVVRTETGF